LLGGVSVPSKIGLTVTWYVNGTSVQTNSLPSGSTALPTNVTYTATFPFGTNTIVVSASDGSSNNATCTTTVTVVDTNPPVVTAVHVAPTSIWPPNHKLKAISVRADVTDDCSATTWKVVSVSSNEAVDAKGSGHTTPDWVIIGDHAVKVRAERSGKGSGRVYTITVQATDAAGNVSAPATATVTVPHDKGNHGANKPAPKPANNGHGKK
jgi:hypothetical protein